MPTATDELIFFVILYVKFPLYPSLPDGNELEATYAYPSSVYKFWISDRITLFPNCIGTTVLFALLTFLLKSYFTSFSAVKVKSSRVTLFSANTMPEIYAPDEDTTLLVSLSKISTSSPIFKLDLSIGLFKVKLLIFSISYLDPVLYIQEFAKTSLYVLLFCGFWIKSPIFLTEIICPSSKFKVSDTWTNLDSTPVSLNSTFLFRSPFSYPK